MSKCDATQEMLDTFKRSELLYNEIVVLRDQLLYHKLTVDEKIIMCATIDLKCKEHTKLLSEFKDNAFCREFGKQTIQ